MDNVADEGFSDIERDRNKYRDISKIMTEAYLTEFKINAKLVEELRLEREYVETLKDTIRGMRRVQAGWGEDDADPIS